MPNRYGITNNLFDRKSNYNVLLFRYVTTHKMVIGIRLGPSMEVGKVTVSWKLGYLSGLLN